MMNVSGTSSNSRPNAAADARLAAYLDEVAARIDDPAWDATYRLILDDDPSAHRAWFNFDEDTSTPCPPPAPPRWAMTVLIMLGSLAVVLLLATVPALVMS